MGKRRANPKQVYKPVPAKEDGMNEHKFFYIIDDGKDGELGNMEIAREEAAKKKEEMERQRQNDEKWLESIRSGENKFVQEIAQGETAKTPQKKKIGGRRLQSRYI